MYFLFNDRSIVNVSMKNTVIKDDELYLCWDISSEATLYGFAAENSTKGDHIGVCFVF